MTFLHLLYHFDRLYYRVFPLLNSHFIKNTHLIRITILLASALLMVSCIKEEFHEDIFDVSLNLTPGLAIPIGYSHLEIEKYLQDSALSELHISEDGFLTLFYSSDVFNENMGNFLSFSPVSLNTSLLNTTGMTIDLQGAGITFNINDSLLIPVSLDQTGVRIDSLHLLGGILQVDMTQTGLNGTVTFTFPGVQMYGVPYIITRNISDPDFTLDLAGYSIIPERDINGDHFNVTRVKNGNFVVGRDHLPFDHTGEP